MRVQKLAIKEFIKVFILAGLILFYLFIFFSNANFTSSKILAVESLNLAQEVSILQKELQDIKQELSFYENFKNFAFEKYAREELAMGKKEDMIFFM